MLKFSYIQGDTHRKLKEINCATLQINAHCFVFHVRRILLQTSFWHLFKVCETLEDGSQDNVWRLSVTPWETSQET